MKRSLFAGMLVLATTAAQAQNTTASNPNNRAVQAYTTLGPAGAGVYRETTQPNAGSGVSHARAVGTRKPRYE
jgi:hypothetical protein